MADACSPPLLPRLDRIRCTLAELPDALTNAAHSSFALLFRSCGACSHARLLQPPYFFHLGNQLNRTTQVRLGVIERNESNPGQRMESSCIVRHGHRFASYAFVGQTAYLNNKDGIKPRSRELFGPLDTFRSWTMEQRVKMAAHVSRTNACCK